MKKQAKFNTNNKSGRKKGSQIYKDYKDNNNSKDKD